MLRLSVVIVFVLSALAPGLQTAAAASDCRFCLDSLVLQTRDGAAWTDGQPLALVVHVDGNAAAALPSSAQIVVMQTDGDRTKCLGVPLKLVGSDAAGGGTYAGVFFPFRPARYDGVLQIGGDVQNIAFDVHQVTVGTAPVGDLPAAEPIDTSARGPLEMLATALRSIIALVI